MTKISTFILIYFIGLIFPAHAIDNDFIQDIDIAILTIDQMPYGYTSKNGDSTGVLFEIMNEIVTLANINSKNVITPSKRIYNLINSNTKMCTLAADTPLMMEKLDGIEPINYFLQAGVLPKAGIELSDYSSLKGITIAVPLGIKVDDKFYNDKNLIKVFPSQYLNAIKMLKINRVDAVAGAISTLKFIAKLEGMKGKELDEPLVFSQYNVHLFCSFNLPEMTKKKLKQAVITLKNTGRITKILNNYFNSAS